jgi:hypothetical protein
MATIADFQLHGFDVSHFQPSAPDFTQRGRAFAIFKASEGVTVRDPNFAANRAAAHAQGLKAVGMYHFARPGSNAARDEAKQFLKVVGKRAEGEFAVLDYEVEPWSEDWAVEWLDAVRDGGWQPRAFYTFRAMLTANSNARIKATGVALWVAAYSKTVPKTGDWPWTFWQHTNGTDAPDPDSPRWDCSVFHTNDRNELAAFAGAKQEDDFLATLNPDEQRALFTAVLESRNIVGNLQAVATRDIDTLAPLITEVLEAVKASPRGAKGPGEVDPKVFIRELKKALVRGEAPKTKKTTKRK